MRQRAPECPTCKRPMPGIEEPLTPTLRDTMVFLQTYVQVYGVAPTYDEVAKSLGLGSTSAAATRINSLIERGYLRRDKFKWRGLTIQMEV